MIVMGKYIRAQLQGRIQPKIQGEGLGKILQDTSWGRGG